MKKIFKGMENGPEAIDSNFNELADPKRDQVFHDLKVDGRLSGKPTREVVQMDFGPAIFWRFGPLVLMYVSVEYKNMYTSPWGYMGGFLVPAGYRPVEKTVVNVINDFKTTQATIDLNGALMATDSEYNSKTMLEIQGVWMTNDDYRN
ncbi:hypothetical protein ACT5YR_02015 [Fructobacillus fructosus]|uniref:hypothetical protein n=1 Tax=Fructobacillus fructosus TaxID=1631 RepID=UPI004034B449